MKYIHLFVGYVAMAIGICALIWIFLGQFIYMGLHYGFSASSFTFNFGRNLWGLFVTCFIATLVSIKLIFFGKIQTSLGKQNSPSFWGFLSLLALTATFICYLLTVWKGGPFEMIFVILPLLGAAIYCTQKAKSDLE